MTIRHLTTCCATLCLLAAAACGDKSGEAEAPAAKTPAAKPTPAAPAAKPAAKPAAPEPAAAPAPALTKKKLDELDPLAWMDILKAAGWTDIQAGGMAMGAWEQTTLRAKQGDKKVEVTIVSPSGGKEDPRASVKARSPRDQLADLQAKGAAELLRDDFVVGVAIEGDPEGARALLDHIKKWVIVD